MAAEDYTNLGGALSTDLPGRFAIQLPAPNVSEGPRRDAMLAGFSVFHNIFTKGEGAGPFVVNNSCGGCHVENGRGPVKLTKSNLVLSSAVIKVALAGKASDGSPRPVPGVGTTLQNHKIKGGTRFSASITWQKIKGRYPDGEKYTLRRPKLRYKISGNDKKVRDSLRMSPAIIGPGLIEFIPEASILERSDVNDANADGISGKPNYVADKASGLEAIGRFGYKAAQPTVKQQSLAAFFGEMGLENEFFKKSPQNASEVNSSDVEILLAYQNLAGVPQARNQSEADVLSGQSLFFEIGCESCHRANFITASSTDPELDNQTIHPFSDFLLHDMGKGLADKFSEFDAAGKEWRTAPLWGLGFASTISNVEPKYLHDGRARSIEEAILWHGGEAAVSRGRFKNLSKADREKLIKFLESL